MGFRPILHLKTGDAVRRVREHKDNNIRLYEEHRQLKQVKLEERARSVLDPKSKNLQNDKVTLASMNAHDHPVMKFLDHKEGVKSVLNRKPKMEKMTAASPVAVAASISTLTSTSPKTVMKINENDSMLNLRGSGLGSTSDHVYSDYYGLMTAESESESSLSGEALVQSW